MVNPFYFDYLWFEKILADELVIAFTDLQRIRNGQTAYSFGITGHCEFERLSPFLLTEEMLWQSVDQCLEEVPGDYWGMSRDNLRWRYRYCAVCVDPDYMLSPYLEKSNKIIQEGMSSFDGMVISARKELPEHEVAQIIQEHEVKYRSACLNALQSLNDHDCLGIGTERDHLVVLFDLYGRADPAYPVWEDVVALNPPKATERYRIAKAKADSFSISIKD